MPILTLSTELWTLAEHEWPDAPDHRRYLAHPHPHTFHLVVELAREQDVAADDRPVELHDLRDELSEACRRVGPIRTQSCEGIAAGLQRRLAGLYPGWDVSVAVYEEGLTGARVGP